MKRLLTPAILVVTLALGLSAQESSEVFAPFVSRLKATAGEEAVVLTWRKSQDVDGSYLIYRSAKEITEATFPEAEFLGRVAADNESYTDYPPFGAPVWYAVLIESTDGRLYSIFIPFRNKTSSAVTIVAPRPETDIAAEIRALSASVQGQSVVVTFTSTSGTRELLLFRSTRPIRRVEDLVETSSLIPLGKGATLYEDRPIAGVEYFYGVVDAGLLQSGKAPIVPGQNSTRTGVTLPLGVGRTPSPARSRPLPRLMIPTGIEFGDELIPSPPFELPRVQELGPTAAKAVARIRAGIRPAPAASLQPVTLEAEKAALPRGEDSILAEIVRTSFADRNYSDAEDRLKRFLRIDRALETKARAHFYLGQIYFFRGETRQAFLTFLLAYETYYEQTQPWLDACFDALS